MFVGARCDNIHTAGAELRVGNDADELDWSEDRQRVVQELKRILERMLARVPVPVLVRLPSGVGVLFLELGRRALRFRAELRRRSRPLLRRLPFG